MRNKKFEALVFFTTYFITFLALLYLGFFDFIGRFSVPIAFLIAWIARVIYILYFKLKNRK